MRRPPVRVKAMPGPLRSTRHRLRRMDLTRRARRVLLAAVVLGSAGCASAPIATGVPVPGTSGAPREVNIITKDYTFLPDSLDLAPGETVLLHVINGGLEVHE